MGGVSVKRTGGVWVRGVGVFKRCMCGVWVTGVGACVSKRSGWSVCSE